MTKDFSYDTLVLMGRPGSGKGTQAAFIAAAFGFQTLSSGQTFRAIAKKDTIIGHKIKEIIEGGELAPQWYASHLFKEAFFQLKPGEKIVFDGFCRKEGEAREFEDVSAWLHRAYAALNIIVSPEESRTRLEVRKEKEGRADDSFVEKRMAAYERDTVAAIEYFRRLGKVIDIHGEQTPAEVFAEIQRKVFEKE